MKLEEKELEKPIRAWIGIDWADEKHDVSLYDVGTGKQEALTIRQSPEALQGMAGAIAIAVRRGIRRRGSGTRPGRVAERADGL
jgi:hypothetical protein